MPRKYVRKTESNYSIDDINCALSEVKDKQLTAVDAARQYNIPIGTLYSRLSGLRGSSARGHPSILSTEEEKLLVHVIELFQEWQQPLTRKCVINMARTYMIELGKNISSDSRLSEWLYSFMSRWRDRLKIMTSMKLERIRSQSCTREVITKWFDRLRSVLTELNLSDKPASIWNVDESGFFDDPGRRQVIVKRSTRYAIASQSGTGKAMTTVILCTSAAGRFLPPYVIYKASKLYDSWCPKQGYPGARYNVSSTGWTDCVIFNDWFIHHFIPNVKNEKRPILLIMDGYKSHISTSIIKLAMDHNIHIECLPPHSTTLLQPLDVVTLSKVKTAWRQLLKTYNQKTNSKPIDKAQFALLIGELFKNHILPSHCIAGFLRSGIYPYDRRVISKEKLLQPTTTTNSSYQPPHLANSTDKPNLQFNDLPTNSCHSTTRPSSCPNIVLYDQNFLTENLSTVTSSSNYYLTPPPRTFFNTSSLIGSSELLHDGNSSSLPNNNEKVANQSVLNAITAAIDKHMSPMVTANNKRKRIVERPYGESLTSVEAFLKVQEKENKRKKVKLTSKKSTLKSMTTTSNILKQSTNKKNRNKKNTIIGIDEEDSFSSNMNQDFTQNEMAKVAPVSTAQQPYISHTVFQSPFYHSSMSNPTSLQPQTDVHSSYTMAPLNQSPTETTSFQPWIYWQYPTTNNFSLPIQNFSNL
ncbi:unnamed protein product [Rotaria sp. Silwood2]|nr:unnamed protein product [Rotaria sp. Silwood2]